jgi:hypothetical protein
MDTFNGCPNEQLLLTLWLIPIAIALIFIWIYIISRILKQKISGMPPNATNTSSSQVNDTSF